jgi:hypothetical protein
VIVLNEKQLDRLLPEIVDYYEPTESKPGCETRHMSPRDLPSYPTAAAKA